MKNRKENTKGWFEEKDPILGKAKRHHEVSVREKLKSTLRTPLLAPLKRECKDKEVAEELADEIIEDVQDSRQESAKAKDESRTAKKVGSKEDAEDLVEWVREPGKSDLEGVDNKSSKPSEEVEEE